MGDIAEAFADVYLGRVVCLAEREDLDDPRQRPLRRPLRVGLDAARAARGETLGAAGRGSLAEVDEPENSNEA
ncbi:hypothetical protein LZK73_08105 [Neorhizobium galegae]|nr:hypothetical protein LZK73_08105 [Neorhizobium galegae]